MTVIKLNESQVNAIEAALAERFAQERVVMQMVCSMDPNAYRNEAKRARAEVLTNYATAYERNRDCFADTHDGQRQREQWVKRWGDKQTWLAHCYPPKRLLEIYRAKIIERLCYEHPAARNVQWN